MNHIELTLHRGKRRNRWAGFVMCAGLALAVGACSDDPIEDADASVEDSDAAAGDMDGDEAVPDSKPAVSDSKPAVSDSKPVELTDDPPRLTTVEVDTVKEYPDEEPIFNVTRPAELTDPGYKLPVVAWANGGCFKSDFTWAPLFERWAAAGFVVLSLTSTGGGGEEAGLEAIREGQTTADDQRELIDWVFAQNESGPYEGLLDLDRVIVAGNSCGGVTAMAAASADDRVAGVFVLSGSSAVGSVNEEVVKGIDVPVGFVVGGEEDVAGANALGDYEFLNPDLPGLLVQRFEGDHMTVSTDPEILPQVAEIALNWFDLVLYGNKAAMRALKSETQCEACEPGVWSTKSKGLKSLVQ